MTEQTDQKPAVPLYATDPSLRTKSPWMNNVESVADFLFETLKRALVLGTISYIDAKTELWTIHVLSVLAGVMLASWLFVKLDWWATAFITRGFTREWSRRQQVWALHSSTVLSSSLSFAIMLAVFQMAEVTASK